MKNQESFSSYTPEELFPLFSRLAARYAGYESTSLPYEKAQQLMGSILYCIREYEQAHPHAMTSTAKNSGSKSPTNDRIQEAEAAYRLGLRLVKEKVQRLMTLYHTLLPDFHAFGIHCLEDTFFKGIPEFFKWYDPEYAAQDTILTLDYPILADLHQLSGVDAVHEYVRCLSLEQRFLRKLDPCQVQAVLREFSPEYPDLIENICDMLLFSACRNRLRQTQAGFISRSDLERLLVLLCGQDEELMRYLSLDFSNLVFRLNNLTPTPE